MRADTDVGVGVRDAEKERLRVSWMCIHLNVGMKQGPDQGTRMRQEAS